MRTLMARFVALLLAGIVPLPAAAWSHANKWGGSTSHEQGTTTRTDAAGGSETHTQGEGTTATNRYGDTATHKEGSGQTTVTNPYGGSATHTYGEGTEYHGANGGTAYKSPYYHPDYAYHPPAYAYHPPAYAYHPPTTVNVYGSSCGSCGGWSTAGAVAVGVVAGAAIATHKEEQQQQQQAATANAYSAGYAAGATNTAYAMGAVYPKTPTGCATPVVGGQSYYLCGNTWFKPSYGANGVFYTVVPPP